MSDKSVSVVGGTARLVAIAAIAAVIVALAWQVTRRPIAENLHAQRMAEFSAVLGSVSFDTLDYDNFMRIEAPHDLPGDEAAIIYTAMRDDQVAAWVFVVQAAGYNGPIRLMIGLNPALDVTAVRVLEHAETPGLADGIERSKSDWIDGFNNERVVNESDPRWALRQQGGAFDSFTGASITPRAIVHAVRDTVAWAKRNSEDRLGTKTDD
ncbi:MAG: RnfABCDGE type electron transport complex subunit G [Pseudomonadota bacterium]